MKPTLLVFAFLLVSVACFAQGGNTVIITFPGAPTGTCAPIMVALNMATGQYYDCLSGSWNLVGGGGGSGSCPAGSANAVQKSDGVNCVASTLTDNGTTVTATKGKVTVQDATAVTGSTLLTIKAGAAQTPAAGSLLVRGYDATPTENWNIDAAGNYNGAAYIVGTKADIDAGGTLGGTHLANDMCIAWSSTAAYSGSIDTGICRSAAGVVQINNGTAGTGADQTLRNQTVNGTQNYCSSSTGSDTYTCNLSGPALTAYTIGGCINFFPTTTSNTGAASIAVNGLAAIPIKTSLGNDPVNGAIVAGSNYYLCLDATAANFLMPQDNSASGQGINTITISGSNAINGKFFLQKLTLSGDSTISAINNIKVGLYVWIICQDGSGGHAFTWPASVLAGMTIGGTASKCNTQEFASDGTTLYATTPGVTNE